MAVASSKSLAWAPISLLVLLIGFWGIYLIYQPRHNLTPSHPGPSKEGTVGSRVSTISFSGISLQYPLSWTSQAMGGEPNCLGFISPELSAFNAAFAADSPNVHSTDAVVAYDVTICTEGVLSGTLQKAADQWISQSGADDIAPVQIDNPFNGALRYRVSLLTKQDVVFFTSGEYLIRASLPQLPYPASETNRGKIITLLTSLRSKSHNTTIHTYDSLKSTLAIFNERRPSLRLQYPDDLDFDEELGGLYFWKGPMEDGQINLYWDTGASSHVDWIERCKTGILQENENYVIENPKPLTIASIPSVSYSYYLPDEPKLIYTMICGTSTLAGFTINAWPIGSILVDKKLPDILTSMRFIP